MSEAMKWARIIVCAALLPAASAASPTTRPPVSAVWHAHHAVLEYHGIGALYTCDGIRSKVRDILRFLGARKDIRLAVGGCSGFDRPSRTANVTVDFHTLAVSGASVRYALPAHWSRFLIAPEHPFFLDPGECELVQQLESLIRADFSLRDLRYEVACAPREIQLGSYEVTGEVLRADPAAGMR